MRKLLIALLALLSLCAGACAAEAPEVTKDAKFSVPFIESGTLRRMTDRDSQTAMQTGKVKEPVVNVAMKSGECAAVYLEFGNNVMPFSVQVREGKDWVDIAAWDQPYAQAYLEFAPQSEFRLRFETHNKYTALYIREIYLFAEGERNAAAHVWQPTVEKADLLVLVAHPDDELLWLGGTLPVYAGQYQKDTVVAYLTCANSCRRQELLNGLWHCGVRTYPDIGAFEDIKSYDATKLYPKWGGTEQVDTYVVRLLRRYRPEVVVTHALDGEYGHAAHVICARSMSRACELAADPVYDPDSAAQYGAWEVKKIYLHKGEQPTLVMDWRQPLTAFDGRTGFDVACEAYKLHASQPQPKNGKKSLYEVADENAEHSSFIYTLIHSAVGEDTEGGDFFEHID